MADRLTPEKRGWNMSQIRGKDTAIEVRVRKFFSGLDKGDLDCHENK